MQYLGSVSNPKDLVNKEYVDITKDGLTFDEYLINNCSYTIQTSDLESGQWSYSIKADNTARARTKYLIPVRNGMIIYYQNTTFDIFFGVLETTNSISYIQTIGWQTNSSGYININQNGYLTFVIRNHADITAEVNPADFNSVVTIQTSSFLNFQSTRNSLKLDDNIDLIAYAYNETKARYNTTIQNISFTWNEDKTACTLNGVNTSSSPVNQYFFGSTTTIPSVVTPGETYYVSVSTTNPQVVFGFYTYIDGTFASAYIFNTNGVFTIPSTTTGILGFVGLRANQTANNDVISNFGIQKYPTRVVQDMISDEYNSSLTYSSGDYCIYNGKFYKCITSILTPEEWTPSKWTETKIGTEISALMANIRALESLINT